MTSFELEISEAKFAYIDESVFLLLSKCLSRLRAAMYRHQDWISVAYIDARGVVVQ